MRLFSDMRARDDRDQRCGSVSITALTFGDDTLDPADQKALMRRLKLVLKSASTGANAGHLVSVVVFLAIMSGAIVYRGPYDSLVFLGALVFSIFLSTEIVKRFSRPRVTRTIIAEGLCGGCGYTLRDLTPASDGCVVCPECGAAWLAARIARPYWERQTLPVKTTKDARMLAPDARGAYVRMLNYRLSGLTRERRSELGEDEVRRMRRLIRDRERPARIIAGVLTAAIVGALTWLIWFQSDVIGPASAVWVWLSLCLVIGPIVVVGFRQLAIRWRWAARTLVGASRCGACAEDLSEVEPDSDGLLTCGCCGAAWEPGS